MSERLYVGKTKDYEKYDGYIPENKNVRDILIKDLECYRDFLKIRIGDLKLFKEIEKEIEKTCNEYTVFKYPNRISSFYYKKLQVENPTVIQYKLFLLRCSIVDFISKIFRKKK